MKTRTILVADDDRAIRTVLTQALGREGYDVKATGNAATLWSWINDGKGDLIVTDVLMPDENGLDLIPRIRERRPDLRVIVMSAQTTLMTAVKATERGAFEYLPKPFDLQEIVSVVGRALSASEARTLGHAEGPSEDDALPLIGRSPAMQEIYRTLARLMGTDLTVVIYGESGTGKELVAKALHDYGKRRKGPFVALNMAAIPQELIESELFGHEKGAFTGANHRYAGRFEQAAGGTLFLDEIGDMPLAAQTRLLRVLQEGEYTTLGGRTPIKANTRVIAATHRDLRQMVRQGLFREDLFYRLQVVPMRLPPLRERTQDIPELVRHFFTRCEAEGLPRKSIDAEGMTRLRAHSWPGNIRELENLVRRLSALYTQEVVTTDTVEHELGDPASQDTLPAVSSNSNVAAAPRDEPLGDESLGDESLGDAVERHVRDYFAAHDDGLPTAGLYDRVLREIERPLITVSLEATQGNQLRAARLLGLNRNTLRKKIRELDIDVVRVTK